MWLSIITLSVDQGHKNQSAGQDREIEDHVKFEEKALIYSFIILTFHQPRPRCATSLGRGGGILCPFFENRKKVP